VRAGRSSRQGKMALLVADRPALTRPEGCKQMELDLLAGEMVRLEPNMRRCRATLLRAAGLAEDDLKPWRKRHGLAFPTGSMAEYVGANGGMCSICIARQPIPRRPSVVWFSDDEARRS